MRNDVFVSKISANFRLAKFSSLVKFRNCWNIYCTIVMNKYMSINKRDSLGLVPKDQVLPVDDGAADHLTGLKLPSIPLATTSDEKVDLSLLQGRVVLYCYPKTIRPDQYPPKGWNDIPGARGCTPQACAFRDKYKELLEEGCSAIFGLSTQPTDYQKEVLTRLQLPFALLSDHELKFAKEVRLPTFEIENLILTKRITLIIENGVIVKVFYPVFPPAESANEVLKWCKANKK